MEWIKKNWWVLFVAPIVIYFAYRYFMSKYELAQKMQTVRDAKEDKRILTDSEYVSDN